MPEFTEAGSAGTGRERHEPEGSRWITVHPAGKEEKGQPVLVSGSGMVLGGMGGKFNGQHISDVHKGSAGTSGNAHTQAVHPEHNAHMATWQGMQDVADVTVHGTPERHANGDHSVHIAGGKDLERTLNQHGQGTTESGAFLEKHPSGGVIYHGTADAPREYGAFAHHMAQDVMSHVMGFEHAKEMAKPGKTAYKQETEAEARSFRQHEMKQIRHFIRGEGGIAPHKKQTEGQQRRGVGATQGDEWSMVPAWATNRASRHTMDTMAPIVAARYPHLGIETEDDLREYLVSHERTRKDDAAAEEAATRGRKYERAARQGTAPADAPETQPAPPTTPEKPAAPAPDPETPAEPSQEDGAPEDESPLSRPLTAEEKEAHKRDNIQRSGVQLTDEKRKWFDANPHVLSHVAKHDSAFSFQSSPLTPTRAERQRMGEAEVARRHAVHNSLLGAGMLTRLQYGGVAPHPAIWYAGQQYLQEKEPSRPAVPEAATPAPERPTWDTAPRGEEGDYVGGHLRFNRESWQTFAVDHPASIAEYNRLHAEGKRDDPYDPRIHHVIQPLTGSAGDHPVSPPMLAPKSAVAEQSKYIKRGAYSPEQQAAVDHLNAQKVKPPAADSVPLFADAVVKDKPTEAKTKAKKQEGGLLAGLLEAAMPAHLQEGGWSKAKRDALPDEDFAGPHQSFPIRTQKDVEDAARLIGHADDPAAVKARITAIAKRKGLKVPASWHDDSAMTEAADLDGAGDPEEDPMGVADAELVKTEPDVLTPKRKHTRARDGRYNGAETVLERGPRQAMQMAESVALSEAQTDRARREVLLQIISPGFGSSRDPRSGLPVYYTPQALQEAAGLFSRKKCYLNHATPDERKRRPEGDITRWGATVKEAWWDPQRGALVGRARVVNSNLWEAIELDPEEVAVSIHAHGNGRPGTAEGKQAWLVESIDHVHSVDFVTYAGARGGVIHILESDRASVRFTADEQREAERDMWDDMTETDLREARPDIVEAILKSAPQQNRSVDLTEALRPYQERVQRAEERSLDLERKLNNRDALARVDEALGALALPAAVHTRIRGEFREATIGLEASPYADEVALVEAVGTLATSEMEYIKSVTAAEPRKPITGMGPSTTASAPAPAGRSLERTALQEAQKRMDSLLAAPQSKKPAPTGEGAAAQSAMAGLQGRMDSLLGRA